MQKYSVIQASGWESEKCNLWVQQRQQEGEEVLGQELSALCCRVDAVLLNGAGNGVHVGVKHGQQRDVIPGGDEAVGLVEGLDVVGAVVGRQVWWRGLM